MTPTTPEPGAAVLELGLQLPADVRERVAMRLLDSLEPPLEDDPAELKRAWQEELTRRVEGIRNGTIKTYSMEETMAYLRQTLAERAES